MINKNRAKYEVSALIIFIGIFVSGCNREPSDWESAKKVNSESAYTDYMKKHPSGTNLANARQAIERIQFESAKQSKSVKTLEQYLASHPSSPFQTEARRAIDDIIASQGPEPLKDNIKAVSIQLLDGDRVRFAGVSAVAEGPFDPGIIIPRLPCLWVIKSLSGENLLMAKKMGIKEGNVYIQLAEHDKQTTKIGMLPFTTSFRHVATFDPNTSEDALKERFVAMLQR